MAEPVAIEEVETGDYALSRPDDDPDGELAFHAVTRLYCNTTAELVEITVYDAEDGVTETITTTPGHPFWVDGAWEFAAEIAPGDTLTDADGGTLTVSAASHQARHEATYNFCVDEDHTYYVGETSTWVHNASIYETVNGVPIWGRPQVTGTPGHAEVSMREARAMARSGLYTEIHLNRSWRAALGNANYSRRRPDVLGVRQTGQADPIEVISKTDKPDVLRGRNIEAMELMPENERGTYRAVPAEVPDASKRASGADGC